MRTSFQNMATILPEGKRGSVEIRHRIVDERESNLSKLRSMIGHAGEYCPPGKYAVLRINGSIVMSDTVMEHDSNREVLWHARGDVLLAGMGIGMVLIPLLQNPLVSSVTVVELNQDVVDLVQPHIVQFVGPEAAAKLTVVVANIYEWHPTKKGRQFDTMYFDVWTNCPNRDDALDMKRLRKRYAPWLRKGGWAACWKQEDAY